MMSRRVGVHGCVGRHKTTMAESAILQSKFEDVVYMCEWKYILERSYALW
jgi:hypothetical protein